LSHLQTFDQAFLNNFIPLEVLLWEASSLWASLRTPH
jgi:hypothetical protein